MALRLVTTLVALLITAPVVGGERAAVEQHLRAVAPGAVALGRTAPDASVGVVIGFGWRQPEELERLLREQRDPRSPSYGQYLSAAEFSRRFAPRAREVAATARHLRRAGLRVVEVSRSRLLLTARGRAAAVEQALATSLIEVADGGRRATMTASAPRLPAELGARVVAVGSADTLRPLADAALRPATGDSPFDPHEIGRVYGFDRLHAAGRRGADARHATIAIATAFAYDPDDLDHFLRAHAIDRPAHLTEQIAVVGSLPVTTPAVSDTLESTLDVEWAAAMAPASRVLAYVGTDALVTTFLQVYDRIVSDNRAAVMTTSWGRCERDFPASHLDQVDAVFQRAAAQGITILAAAGDRGAYECGGDQPSASFPAAHPYVLAVGGTTLAPGDGVFEERAWPGSGGAASTRYPAPPWQMHPSTGRVLADVALNADPASGYLTRHDDTWMLVGGTSVAAPVWAALVALGNQARDEAGRPPLGVAAPLLCELAHAPLLDPAPLVDVTAGDNGLAAGAGWDFPTGWGTPNAEALAEALAWWTPPAGGGGGTTEIVALTPAAESVAGAVRLRVRRRCLSSEVALHLRGVAAGVYTLVVDGQPAASVTTDRAGNAIASLPDLDLRGRRVQLVDERAAVRFTDGTAPVGPVDPVETANAQAALLATGAAIGARGALVYRAVGGREQLAVSIEGLPRATYEIRLGGVTLGAVSVTSNGRSAEARFDSLGLSGEPLPSSPLCTAVMVVKDGVAYLRSPVDALTPGGCGRKR